jgi:hypothetical protein
VRLQYRTVPLYTTLYMQDFDQITLFSFHFFILSS